MITIPQMDCCLMLGIDPKTLRNWLRHAHMQFAAHPTDARLKCLTQAQVQQLAALHGRPLPDAPPALVPVEQHLTRTRQVRPSPFRPLMARLSPCRKRQIS